MNTGSSDGGNGGVLNLSGGAGLGTSTNVDIGGTVSISGGNARGATGGSISLLTGHSLSTSSGSIVLDTANSGLSGVSGHIFLASGSSSNGATGSISLHSGDATVGKAGSIALVVGKGDSSHGGEINLIAGKIDGDSDAAISGGAILVNLSISFAWFIPSSKITYLCLSLRPSKVSGIPISLLKFPFETKTFSSPK